MVSLLLADSTDPVQRAIERYQNVMSYQVTMKSLSGDRMEVIRYSYRKPGHVRMDFMQPYKGAVLIYDPATKQATLWPFGHHSFPVFTLSPENRLIRSTTGQRVDRSDIGALFRNVQALQQHGKTEILGAENLGGKETVHVSIEGGPQFSVEAVHRYELWLDEASAFPVKVFSHDAARQLIESVELDQLLLNPSFPDNFFSQ